MMNKNSINLAIITGIAALLPMHAVMASDAPVDKTHPQVVTESAQAHAADNTARNARDSKDTTILPTDQPNNQADIDVAAAVRSAIVDDDSLSMAAHNIKLVASNGAVVLRGPVESAAEKSRISALVKQMKGVTSVDNQLEVKAN